MDNENLDERIKDILGDVKEVYCYGNMSRKRDCQVRK